MANSLSNKTWNLILSMRLYLIIVVLWVPLIHLNIHLTRISSLVWSLSIILMLILLKYVFLNKKPLNSRKTSIELKSLKFAVSIVIINFSFGLIIHLSHIVYNKVILEVLMLLTTINFFALTKRYQILVKFQEIVSNKQNQNNMDTGRLKKSSIFTNHFFGFSLIFWTILTGILISLPYTITNYYPISEVDEDRIGFWTYGPSFDPKFNSSNRYVDNDTLQVMADANAYIIYGGLKPSKMNSNLINNLTRLKEFGIEVHIWISPSDETVSFTNIWSFESLQEDMIYVLDYLNDADLISDPITTVVYDMEGMAEAHFPLYGLNYQMIRKLNDYYRILENFSDFNQWIRNEYHLKIRICTDIYQGFDIFDGDDDISALWGLMNDRHPETTLSYMVYRRNNMGMNYIMDHCRYLKGGDTIILNSWKNEDYFCWEKLNCAIQECRLVLSYPHKQLNLEIWDLYYFLRSYQKQGLIDLIENITSDRSLWAPIPITNQFPYSFYSDIIFLSASYLDWFAPLFRTLYWFFK